MINSKNFIEVNFAPGLYVIKKSYYAQCEPKLLEWCRENVKNDWYYDVHPLNYYCTDLKRYHLKFHFKELNEAILFKLTF